MKIDTDNRDSNKVNMKKYQYELILNVYVIY